MKPFSNKVKNQVSEIPSFHTAVNDQLVKKERALTHKQKDMIKEK